MPFIDFGNEPLEIPLPPAYGPPPPLHSTLQTGKDVDLQTLFPAQQQDGESSSGGAAAAATSSSTTIAATTAAAAAGMMMMHHQQQQQMHHHHHALLPTMHPSSPGDYAFQSTSGRSSPVSSVAQGTSHHHHQPPTPPPHQSLPPMYRHQPHGSVKGDGEPPLELSYMVDEREHLARSQQHHQLQQHHHQQQESWAVPLGSMGHHQQHHHQYHPYQLHAHQQHGSPSPVLSDRSPSSHSHSSSSPQKYLGPSVPGLESRLDFIQMIDKNPNTKRFDCPYDGCYKSFGRRFNLKAHYSSSHAQIKRFACPQCAKRFARNSDVKRHLGTVHKERDEDSLGSHIPGMLMDDHQQQQM